MMHGYYHKRLRINLDGEKIETDTIPDALLDRFIGGSGLAAKILCDHPNADLSAPFSSRNPLIFATGPFTGSTIPCSGHHGVVGQSPLTGIFGESDVGGRFGTALKKTGHHLIEIGVPGLYHARRPADAAWEA
jgi:aldehyde:ferredoxin oxidoreductase